MTHFPTQSYHWGVPWTLQCSSQRMGCGASSEIKYAGRCGDKVFGFMSISKRLNQLTI